MAKNPTGNHRNATSGRYTTEAKANANKAGHQTEPRGKSGESQGSPYRSTKTGLYVTETYGKAHPATTVKEK